MIQLTQARTPIPAFPRQPHSAAAGHDHANGNLPAETPQHALFEALIDYMVENGIPMPEEGTEKGRRFMRLLTEKLIGDQATEGD